MGYKRYWVSDKRGLLDCFRREGLLSRVLVNAERGEGGNGIGERQGLLVVGRGRGTQQHAGEEERIEG